MILEIKGIIDAVKDIGKATGGAAGATTMLAKVAKFLSKSVENVGAVMPTIAAGTGVAVTWAVFAAQAALMDLTYREMGNLVALTIGQTIVMVIMFIIDLIPVVGGIISGIISLLDSLIAAICSAAGWDQEKAGQTDPYDDPGDWLCGGLEGIVSTFLGWFIYAGNEIVDMQAEGRLQFDEVNADELTDPELGITTGNALNVGVVLTNTLTVMGRPGNIGGGYYWQYRKNLDSSTFDYQMQTAEIDIHEDLDRGDMQDEWQDVPEGQTGDIYIHKTVPTIPVTLPAAGINRRLQVYLSEGYNIPVQNCYVGVCVVEDERDTIHYPMTDTLVFDILPATLDEFYTRSWGRDYSIGVVTMKDEDGDGLAAGVDPNDLLQDTDGDGLIDPRELQFGSSPTLVDTDGDGLNDYDEIRLNTDPTRKDTDGDGLWDGQEVYHQDKTDADKDDDRVEWVGGWRYVYRINAAGQQESAWVTSDPEKVDTDDDGLLDRDEFLYGFNPTVWSNARVLSLESQLQEPAAEGGYAPTDGMVQPGSTLYYTATVTNNLLSRYMQGLLSSQFPAATDPNALAPVSFVLQPAQAQTLDGELDVSATAASGVYSATLTASALISDWTALAEGAKLWLPMDDPVTTDRSGSFPPNDATCMPVADGHACASVVGGPYGNALSLDGASYLSSPADPSETAYGVSLWFKTSQAGGALFAATGGDGAEVYLSGGRVCAAVRRNGVAEAICSAAATYADSQWHHAVHTFGGGVGAQQLYVDGEAVASGTETGLPAASTGGVLIGKIAFSAAALFSGMLDDVRLYDTALSAHQARQLFRQPVLNLTFDHPTATSSGTQWADTSAFGNRGECATAQCPQETVGIEGQGLQFDGANRHVSVAENSSLDLSEGHFTLALWLKPEAGLTDAAHCGDFEWEGQNCGWWQPEGILGLKSGTGDAYVSLQRMVVRGGSNAIRFGFAAADGWAGYYTSPAIGLMDNVWNHVALSYGGGEVRLYLNGELVASDQTIFINPGTGVARTPAATRRFEIGRSNDVGKVNFSSFSVWGESDSGNAELCIACTGQEMYNGSVSGGNSYPINASCAFTDQTYWQIWEDDQGTTCGATRDNGDQFITGASFAITDPATPGHGSYVVPCLANMPCMTMPDGANVTGILDYSYTKDSLPFRGAIDELRIYRQVLDAADVREIFLGTNTALNLGLDEAPGATSFADASAGNHDATCAGAACPTAGVGGRDGRAALFKTGEQDHLTVNGLSGLTQTTVSAWIYRTQATNARETIVSSQESASCGFTLALNDNGSSQYPMFAAWIADGATSALKQVEFAEAVPLNTWVHLAGVYDGAQLRLYRNGTEVATVAAAGALKQCTGNTAIGSHSDGSQKFFGGRIDAARVYVRGLSAAEMRGVYDEAPVLHLRLDEAYGATQFADESDHANATGACTGEHCPVTGEGVHGQLGLAALFDGADDEILAPDAATLRAGEFTVGAWVLPTRVNPVAPQEIIVRSASEVGGEIGPQPTLHANYRLYLKPNTLIPVAEFDDGCTDTVRRVTSQVSLVKDHWNHVMASFDGERLVLYVNGAEQARLSGLTGSQACAEAGWPLHVGGFSIPAGNTRDWSNPFSGRIDEVALYDRGLREDEIERLFSDQMSWVEERQSNNILVDGDVPECEVASPETYLPAEGMQFLAAARDETSGIAAMELAFCKSAGACTPGNWAPADACTASNGAILNDGTWCPYFEPAGEGRYIVKVRATDRVGNRAESAGTVVYVDNTPPTITGPAAGTRFDAKPAADRANVTSAPRTVPWL